VSALRASTGPRPGVTTELAKLAAFVRRDVRIALSYRLATFGGVLGLAAHALVFSFIGKLVDPSRLPTFGGSRVTYMEFVTIGIALNMVVIVLVQQLAMAIRSEQLQGTLESLLTTPTRVGTIQFGSAALALLTVPLRLGLFIGVLALAFGLDIHAGGVVPAALLVAALLPFLWGLGLLSAGVILTFRRGSGALTVGMTVLGLASGSFFPLSVLPAWLRAIAEANPLALAVHGLREALIGGGGLSAVASDLAQLVPLSAAALVVGMVGFRLALARERRNGTLGLY
jgi:ABC-2 type transport system permease protein